MLCPGGKIIKRGWKMIMKHNFIKTGVFCDQGIATGSFIDRRIGGRHLREGTEGKEMDEAVVKAVEELKRSPTKRLRSEEWSEEQGLVLFRGKVYVPKDVQLRCEIVQLHHDTPVAGHPGRWKTLEMVTWNYWWPGLTKFVFDYVDRCDKCQRYKNFPQPPAGRLMPIGTPSGTMEGNFSGLHCRTPRSPRT